MPKQCDKGWPFREPERAVGEATEQRSPSGLLSRSGACRCKYSQVLTCDSWAPAEFSQDNPDKNSDCPITPDDVWHVGLRLRRLLYASQLRHLGTPTSLGRSRFWRDEANPSSPTAVCAMLALLSPDTWVSRNHPSARRWPWPVAGMGVLNSTL